MSEFSSMRFGAPLQATWSIAPPCSLVVTYLRMSAVQTG